MAAQLLRVALCLLFGLLTSCAPSLIHPKVPEEKLVEARALANPLPKSYWIIDDGKVLYEGKGMCVGCHGRYGDGRGTAASNFQTLPRNFKKSSLLDATQRGRTFLDY